MVKMIYVRKVLETNCIKHREINSTTINIKEFQKDNIDLKIIEMDYIYHIVRQIRKQRSVS